MWTWLLKLILGCCSPIIVWEKAGKLMDAEVRPDLNAYIKVGDEKHKFYR